MIKSSPIRLLTDECNFDLKNRGQIWETQPIRICLMMMMKRKMSVIIENLQGSYSKLGNIYTEKYCLHFRFGNIVVELFSLELLFIKQVE